MDGKLYKKSRTHTQVTQLLPLDEKYYKCMDCQAEGKLSYIYSIACIEKTINKLWIKRSTPLCH